MITGRVADASLFLAPLALRARLAWDDWDRLAAGILVGHLLECSGQSLGGNYSGDWWALPHPWDLPYPIADVDADGTAVISKPEGSGGRVSTDTLRHQLLYEVHDPARYLSPDVVADFTSAHFEDLARRPGAHHRRARHARDRHVQVAALVPRRLGRRGTRSRSRGPTRTRRRRRPPRSSRSGSRWPGSTSTSGASSTGASTRSADRRSRRAPTTTDASRPSACCASRGGATTSAPPDSSDASSCRSRCRRRPRA